MNLRDFFSRAETRWATGLGLSDAIEKACKGEFITKSGKLVVDSFPPAAPAPSSASKDPLEPLERLFTSEAKRCEVCCATNGPWNCP